LLESACEPLSRFDGREVINLASNNCLGLADHPELIETVVAKKYGAP
jgi:glycine C-acetyltransferase